MRKSVRNAGSTSSYTQVDDNSMDTDVQIVVPVIEETVGQQRSSVHRVKRERSGGGTFKKEISILEVEDDKNPQWIPNNINQRECINYSQRPPAKNDDLNNPTCHCGNKRSSHDTRYINEQIHKTEWKTESHTQITQTKAYGEIEFVGAIGSSGTLKQKKYVRLDHLTNPNKVLELLRDHWKLGVPKLLISVTGGALNFHMNFRLREVFRKGLIKAALSTGAWIITGGTHAGVMKYVGDAVRDYALASGAMTRNSVVAIGIPSWGVINQKEKLIKDINDPYAPASYRMDLPGGVKLDPNHTHFLLVDNGTSGKFGVEIKLRAKIEKAISEQSIGIGKDENVSVPTVCVVVEGGPNTIFTVHQAVMNGTPAVIVAGSGRAANILAFAAQRATEVEVTNSTGSKEKKMVIGHKLREKLAEIISKEFGDKELDTHLTRIQECVEKNDLFNVYDMDASTGVKDIDEAILHALLRANKGSVQDQLKLTLVWNRIDIAKSELFTDDRNWKKGELHSALRYALVHNQVDFVKLFLENGVSLKDYLTVRELTLLYNELKEKTLVYEHLDKQRGAKSTRKFTLGDVGKVIEEMTMDSYEPLYLQDQARYVLTEADIVNEPIVEGVDDGDTGAFDSMAQNSLSMGIAQATTGLIPGAQNSRGNLNTFDNPIRELLIWSVLQGRKEMSQFFWEECKEMISAALTSSMILKFMAEKEDDADYKEHLDELSDWFEDFAIGVLNECYNEDEERTSIILVRELRQWGHATCLSLAVNGNMKKFVSQQGVQNLLTEIWMGKLSKDNKMHTLAICVIFPPLIYSLIKFREDENDEEEEESNLVRRSSSKRKRSMKQVNGNNIEGDQLGESLKMVKVQGPTVNGTEAGKQHEDDEYYHTTHDVDIRDSGKELSWYQRFKLFYDSPRITFTHNLIFYFLFLGLFSYIMLANFNPKVSAAEYVLVFWMITLFTEEFRQIAQGESHRWWLRLRFWITDYWNLVDLATIILFSVGFVMRLYTITFSAARVILAIDLMIFYIRLLQVFSVNKNLGPKLIMISKMMVDLAFFMCILFVFLIAYGVASQAIMFPNTSGFFPIVKGIMYKSYFQMYGELFLEDIEVEEGSCTVSNGVVGDLDDPCPEFTWVAIILLSGYMLFSNVLLLNLLIAMFSYTFSAVQDNTDQYWKFQRFEIIQEYFSRPPLAPPFIAISHVYILIAYILRHFGNLKWLDSSSGSLKQRVSEAEIKHLSLWESLNGENYMAGERQKQQQDINERVLSLMEKVDEINQKVEVGPQQAVLGGAASNARIDRLEDQMDRINMAIDWLIQAHIEHGIGCKSGAPKLKEIAYKESKDDFIADEEEAYKVPTTLEEIGIMIHKKARQSPYPGTAIRRSYVPDSKVPWEADFSNYTPKEYTHECVLAMPHWADVDLMAMSSDKRPMLPFNCEDSTCKVDRRSYLQIYTVKDGLPLNPKGRTGMTGRGLLGRFGPNHAADPIATRWKLKTDGSPLLDKDKKVLEFIAIQRKDNQQWAIPGGMVEPGQKVSETLKREFSEEALGQLSKSEEERAEIGEHIKTLFSNGIEIYRGYVDDPRNTDNAWMETVAMNFHDDTGAAFGEFKLEAGDDAQSVRWQRVSSKLPLFASHTAMLRKVAELHNAAF
ncbi:transient receptor potential cation channel subfamily M member-like 2 isoform X2 [Antedon mediterranea]|uniref:transient receptor potential cation channel subfamily M member-like 2 isoform X2 n=1 Tax=Antedon mediterranea TaxID=105859 RepID=UPI003AF4796A